MKRGTICAVLLALLVLSGCGGSRLAAVDPPTASVSESQASAWDAAMMHACRRLFPGGKRGPLFTIQRAWAPSVSFATLTKVARAEKLVQRIAQNAPTTMARDLTLITAQTGKAVRHSLSGTSVDTTAYQQAGLRVVRACRQNGL